MFSAQQNIHRIRKIQETWLSQLQKDFPNNTILFLTDGEIPILPKDMLLICSNDNYTYPFTKLISRFFIGLSAFLKTDCDWYVCTSDDVHIFPDRLKWLLSSLSYQYLPDRIVFKGQVVQYDDDGYYIHGGCGWIFSREAARILIENQESYLKYRKDFEPDDVTIIHALEFLHLNYSDVMCDFLLGSDIIPHQVSLIRSRELYSVPLCKNLNLPYLNTFNYPRKFSDIAIWHGSKSDSFPLVDGWKYIYTIPQNYYVYINESWSYFCLKQ